MRRLAWGSSFRRAFRRRPRNDPDLWEQIFLVLEQLVQDPFDPPLRTHKLRGQLEGLWAVGSSLTVGLSSRLSPIPVMKAMS